MGDIVNINDKIKENYKAFISIRSEFDDMQCIINDYLTQFNYEEVFEENGLENIIIVKRKN